MIGPTGSKSGSIRAMARSAVLAASDWRARLSITPTRTVAPAEAAWCLSLTRKTHCFDGKRF